MDKDARYIAVALFVLITIATATTFVLWYSGARDDRTYQRYSVYFEGTVSGLSVGSAVRYLGVDVGRVIRLSLDETVIGRVRVLIDVDELAPINTSTVATLKLLGITGLVYLELSQAEGPRDKLQIDADREFPIITSIQSDLDRLITDLPRLVGDIRDLSSRASKLLDDSNIEAVAQTLQRVEQSSEDLPTLIRQANAAAVEFRELIASAATVSSNFENLSDSMSESLSTTAERASETASHLAEISLRLERLIIDNELAVNTLINQGGYELQNVLQESRAALRNIRELTEQLRHERPGLLLPQFNEGVEIDP